jgi:hypothetical protein
VLSIASIDTLLGNVNQASAVIAWIGSVNFLLVLAGPRLSITASSANFGIN